MPSDRPTTLNLQPTPSKISFTGPAITTTTLPVPQPGRSHTPSPTHISGQGHITVNLSPVSSPTRCPNPPGSRGTVTSSLNFPSPTSNNAPVAKSPTTTKPPSSQYPGTVPLKFGWADHVFGPKKKVSSPGELNTSNNNNTQEHSSSAAAPFYRPDRPIPKLGSTEHINNALYNNNAQVPLGFERLLLDSKQVYTDVKPESNNVPVVSLSAVSRKKDSCPKPIFKRHSADMHNLIGMANENYNLVPNMPSSGQFCGRAGGNSTNLENVSGLGGSAGPSSLGAECVGDNMTGTRPTAPNRKFFCFAFCLCFLLYLL